MRSHDREGVESHAQISCVSKSEVLDRLERQLRRVGHDLHDGPMQSLTAARLQLEVILATAASDQLAEECAELSQILREAQTELRSITVDLRPPALDESGLNGIIRRHVGDCRRASDIAIDLEFAGECPSLTASAQIAVFRIIQEALNNVRRHSEASRAKVSVRYADRCVECHVVDNGRGFDPSRPHSGTRIRNGLRGMRERAEMLDGSLVVSSASGEGTAVMLRIPLWD